MAAIPNPLQVQVQVHLVTKTRLNLDRMRRYRRRTMPRPEPSVTVPAHAYEGVGVTPPQVVEFRDRVAVWVDAQGLDRAQVSWSIQTNSDLSATISWWVE